jgi:proteasome accessory factor A
MIERRIPFRFDCKSGYFPLNKILRRKRKSIWNRSTQGNRASEPRLLARWLGLESEFFVRHPHDQPRDALADYIELVRDLSKQLPVAPSQSSPLRHFLANGSSISLETGSQAHLHSALFETATPECQSPRDLVAYELANEQLIEKAFSSHHGSVQWSLIKSNTDAHGHTLGQHESYDMRIATGGWLLVWWIGLALLFPCVVLYRIAAILWMGLIYGLWGTERLIQRARWPYQSQKSKPRDKRSQGANADHDTVSDVGRVDPDTVDPVPADNPTNENGEEWYTMPEHFLSTRWLQCTAFGLRCLHRPIAFYFGLLISVVALRPHRRVMSAFLSSRCVLDGAGYVDDDNHFWISQRASQVDCIIGFGSYGRDRPMFRCDAMLRELFSGPYFSFARYMQLFRNRQRVELAIGDSGMCQQSQYLRFGITALILDWVEYADPSEYPHLRSPIEAIREYARDWMLVRTVCDRRGYDQSAKEIQRSYLKQIKRWLQDRSDVPAEAWEIVQQWQTTLNQMVMKPSDQGELPMVLVGRIDWLSKLWLLHQMESDTAWAIKKKIDIRYHELSDQGYHRQLANYLQLSPIVNDGEIERARRAPPSDSPARRRGNLIREMSEGASELRVDWRSASYDLEGVHYHVHF